MGWFLIYIINIICISVVNIDIFIIRILTVYYIVVIICINIEVAIF